jgi:hypothetical protein
MVMSHLIEIGFLDDQRVRHEQLYAVGSRIHHFYSGEEVVEWITTPQNPTLDLLCLDHDLGVGLMTGVELVHFLLTRPKREQPKYVLVHSWNPPGATFMTKLLAEGGIPTGRFAFSADKGWLGKAVLHYAGIPTHH